MDAAALSTEGPAALTDAVTESIAFEEALIASPVFFPINLEASARPAWLLAEYLAKDSAAALDACAEFAERALPASWAAALAASALAAEPARGMCRLSQRRRAAGGGRPRSTRCRSERRPRHAVVARQTWKAPRRRGRSTGR